MSKEATIIQSFNDVKRQYEYFVKGYDVTESVKILLKRHKEEYDKEKKIFASIEGYLEAQNECQSQIADLETKLAKRDKEIADLQSQLQQANEIINNPDTLIFQQQQLIDNLKSQLAEKKKEIESYKHFKITIGTMENNQVDISSTTYTDQDKISFALEQLEKVKDYFIEGYAICKNFSDFYWNFTEQIDNQIEELKKEMNNGNK